MSRLREWAIATSMTLMIDCIVILIYKSVWISSGYIFEDRRYGLLVRVVVEQILEHLSALVISVTAIEPKFSRSA